MEFSRILDLFSHLLEIKKKYPMINTVHKHLLKLEEPGQAREVILFTRWIAMNPKLDDREFTEPKFMGSKKSSPIYFDNCITLGSESFVDTFWVLLDKLRENITPTLPVDDITAAFTGLQQNPAIKGLLADLGLGHINLEDFDPDKFDLDDVLFSPGLHEMVDKLKKGVKSGRYRFNEFHKVFRTAIEALHKSSLEEGCKETLAVLDQELCNATSGTKLNLTRLSEAIKRDPMVCNTKLGGLIDNFITTHK